MLDARLREIVAQTPWLVAALEAARDVDAPAWALGAGAVRHAVWEHLHHRAPVPPTSDVDVAFHDARDVRPERDRQVTTALEARLPHLVWEATNQAAVHHWYERVFGYAVAPLRLTAEGVATWPETATAVALWLDRADRVHVIAPYGLDDLLGLVHRRNPTRVSVAEYERRLAAKDIARRWPRATVVPALSP